MPKTVSAVTDLQTSEFGISKAHIMRCSDGNKYVVKFVKENTDPNLRRTVINELVAGSLASNLRLPCPETVLVWISMEFIRNSVELTSDGVREGYHIGSKFVSGRNFMQFSRDFATGKRIANIEDLYGVIVFDNLVLNVDRNNEGNNLIDLLPNNEVYYRMIDFGHCFTGADWTFQRLEQRRNQERVVDCHWFIIQNTVNNDLFGTWFNLVESIPDRDIELILQDIPSGWGIPLEDRSALIELINIRKHRVRTYISTSRGRLQ